jgi:hypothetical protein
MDAHARRGIGEKDKEQLATLKEEFSRHENAALGKVIFTLVSEHENDRRECNFAFSSLSALSRSFVAFFSPRRTEAI